MTQSENKIRVRFSPSPTGSMHIGSLRTALYNFLFARKHKGDFLLRLEDTDQKRFVPGAAEGLIHILHVFGLIYDEGPFLMSDESRINNQESSEHLESLKYRGIVEVGDKGPYIQSERLEIYKQHAEKLIEEGKAYYCFCTSERLAAMREEQTTRKHMPKYDRHCLALSPEEVAAKQREGLPGTIRFRVPDDVSTVTFEDLIRGEVSFKTETIDDQVILKSDGYPTYHLAAVVDDHLMEITHVIRGEEWLPSTPKHILLYQAFGWELPLFAHLPLLLNPDKSKLAKRQGDVAVEEYLQKGYLNEALINFVALLGWNPGEGSTQEIFSLEDLIERFDFSHVHKGGAVFDVKKLDWLNAQYIKKLPLDELYALSLPFLERKDFYQAALESRRNREFVKKVLTIEQERLTRLDEVGKETRFAFGPLSYERALLRWKDNDDALTRAALGKALEVLETIPEDEWTRERISEKLLEAAGKEPARNATHSVAGGRGDLLWPLRVALTGLKHSPSPFEVAWMLGKDETLKRVRHALGLFDILA